MAKRKQKRRAKNKLPGSPEGVLIKAEEEKVREKTKEQAGDGAGQLLTELPEFLATHPATDSRIERMREKASHQQGPYRDLSATFSALQARVRELAIETSAEESAK